MLMFYLKSHKKTRALTRTSYLGLKIWILLAPVYGPSFATFPRTPQYPLSHGTGKPVTQLKCRGMSIHSRWSLYSQGLVLSHVYGACICHWPGKCLPFPCMRCTPLVMAWEYSQRMYIPWLHFRLQELSQPDAQPLLWQNKELNPHLLCCCPGLPGMWVSFPNWTW